MNWIKNFVRPRFEAVFKKNDTPDNLWVNCNDCGEMIFHRDMEVLKKSARVATITCGLTQQSVLTFCLMTANMNKLTRQMCLLTHLNSKIQKNILTA